MAELDVYKVLLISESAAAYALEAVSNRSVYRRPRVEAIHGWRRYDGTISDAKALAPPSSRRRLTLCFTTNERQLASAWSLPQSRPCRSYEKNRINKAP